MKLYIDPQENPELGEVLDGYNNIMQQWNVINREVHAFVVPFIYAPKTRRKLLELGKRLSDLQKEFLRHQKLAYKFATNPTLRFPDNTDRDLAFNWYFTLLMDRINQARFDIAISVANFNNTMGEVLHSRDFNFALGSFLLGFIGLVVALVSLGMVLL